MRGFAAIGLVNPKCPANIGGAFRAAGCYQAALVVLAGARPHHLCNLPTDTLKSYRHIPHIFADNILDSIPLDCVPVAIEIEEGARTLPTYTHPERAFYIFGPEDGSISLSIQSRCRDIVSIPTAFCMNLASTVNVVLYDRMVKRNA